MQRPALLLFLLLCVVPFRVDANVPDVVCALAPSQHKAIAALSGTALGASAAVVAIAEATGLTVVAHSSTAMILTGSGGYVAGTLGGASAAPFIINVAIAVGATSIAIELVCAGKNHPEQVAKVKGAAVEFARRTAGIVIQKKDEVAPRVTSATVAVKRVAGNVFKYAHRRD